ncbi:coatomer gamma 2-subunit [Babesia ovata]|uniref:Coatomer subunit gamma n=1 Tax=Babesia ovata TaxID=189622 RepID=A0A2H6KF73_9APIC|nr:coatomer gamma 2-subunit [Babesia ovata]GBE61648.1 coatomer gamma 2-subunit [Babesia ovata]
MGVDAYTRADQAMSVAACDKNAILQEAKVFSKVPINSKKCIEALTKILCVINHGYDPLTESETTDVFFGATRLFESNDERLRRLVYLLIKSIRVNETEIFIVTSSLTKDINSPNLIYRANAIRAMCLIVKSNMASQVERYIKSSLVDRDTYVCSSAILFCIRVFPQMQQMIRRWVGEAATCLTNSNEMVQFHGTLMMFLARLNDRQSLRKLVATLRQGKMGVHTECFIIRFVAANFGIMEAECIDLIKSGIKSNKEAVSLEALKAVISLALSHYKTIGSMQGFAFDMRDVITKLQAMLASKDRTLVFAAMRQIYQLAQTLPLLVSVLNGKVEDMLKRKNKDIASLALLTLLQTGGADTIERLLAQATSLSGDFKLAVAKALKRLCVSFPDKHPTVLKFFATNFRDAVECTFKREMVDATMYIVEHIPAAQQLGLKNLCEFIEDCEFPDLNAKVLKFLGDNVPKAETPEEYVRYIYNRLLLENATVRAAGIEALDNIVRECPALKQSVSILLLPCLRDPEDDLRERVNLTYTLMLVDDRVTLNNRALAASTDGEADFDEFEAKIKNSDAAKQLCDVIHSVTEHGSLSGLCAKLHDCIQNKRGYDEVYEDMADADMDTDAGDAAPDAQEAKQRMAPTNSMEEIGVFEQDRVDEIETVLLPPEIVQLLPQGVPMAISATLPLTDEEEDYSVEAKIHSTEGCLVLEFIIGNTLSDQILDDVVVSVDYSQCLNANIWQLQTFMPIPRLTVSEKKSAYLVMRNVMQSGLDGLPQFGLLLGTVKVDLTFEARCGSEDSRSYRESYSANDMHLGIGLYCVSWPMDEAEFDRSWAACAELESCATFGLQFKDIKEAVQGLRRFFGNCSVTQCPGPVERIAVLNVAGKLFSKQDFMAKATVAQGDPSGSAQLSPQKGCILKLQVRTGNRDLADIIFTLLE